MKLHKPFEISSRLLPALEVGDGEVSLEFIGKYNREGKPRLRWHIDTPTGSFHGDDFAAWGRWQSAFVSLLASLGAAAESYRYWMSTQRKSENYDLFPEPVVEWAYRNSDEIGTLELEIEETPNLIEE